MTLQEWEDEKDRELETSLTALFHAAGSQSPPSGFASRTMKAVRRAPLPAGRRALGRGWGILTAPIGWAALIGLTASAAFAFVANQPQVAGAFAALVAFGIRTGVQLLEMVHTSAAVFDVLVTTSGAVSRAMSTTQAAVGLTLMTAVAALSLAMLNRLLVSDKESSSW